MILGIESSCDESAVALFDPKRGVVSSLIHSQLDLHREYGGVVPDLAVREHLEKFPALLRQLGTERTFSTIGTIAVTRGPGLAGCLAIGISAAKACALLWRSELVGVNHLTAHAWSPFIPIHRDAPARFDLAIEALLPHLGLIVSGGNTLLFRIEKSRRIVVLADTRDDAAGEALDKGAKLLGLPYPGGPEVEQRAAKGDAAAFKFPLAFPDPKDRAFSFSGVKTSLRYRLEKMSRHEIEERNNDLCASYQQAVIDALIRKFSQVLKQEKSVRSIGLSGGVANNRALRARVEQVGLRFERRALIAESGTTGDNAAMIAFAAFADPSHVSRDGDSMRFEPGLPLGC